MKKNSTNKSGDLTAVINFHREKLHAFSALQSLFCAVNKAREAGFRCEIVAVLDNCDPFTRQIIYSEEREFGQIYEVHFSDLGKARSHVIRQLETDFVATFDGDDLWGSSWIINSFRFSETIRGIRDWVLHPFVAYYFDATDFICQSATITPHPQSKSFYMLFRSSTDIGFRSNTLRWNNVYTSNIFCKRSILERYPYVERDPLIGRGVEDWDWNANTVSQRVAHICVPETVHLVRIKEQDSLGSQNTSMGVLPQLENYKFIKYGKAEDTPR